VEDANSWLALAFILCLALSAFFSSAEAAFLALPKLRVRYLVENGRKGAELLAKRADKPEKFLSTVLLGNNLVNVAAAALATIMAVAAFGLVRGPIIATIGVTALLLIFGEVIPKTLAVHHAERLSLLYVNPLRAMQWCLYPFVLMLSHIGLGVTRIIAQSDEEKKLISEGEIRSAINVGQVEGVVEQDEARMLHKVFEFTDRSASKVMIPRTEIAWVEQGMKVSEILDVYTQTPYSRFPVYKDNTDNVVGVLFVKDILKKLNGGGVDKKAVIDDLIRPAHFVPEGKHLGELLAEMRDGGYHIVIVVDEYGGVAGMITLNELTEEIIGDIGDELAEKEKEFVVTGDNTFQLDGGFRVEEANQELGLELPEGDYDTVAGFILSKLGRIPRQGEQLKYRHLKFVITEMQGVKIERIVVTREKDAAPAS
jgi:CBS domain containing-hemolysin-like protein